MIPKILDIFVVLFATRRSTAVSSLCERYGFTEILYASILIKLKNTVLHVVYFASSFVWNNDVCIVSMN